MSDAEYIALEVHNQTPNNHPLFFYHIILFLMYLLMKIQLIVTNPFIFIKWLKYRMGVINSLSGYPLKI